MKIFKGKIYTGLADLGEHVLRIEDQLYNGLKGKLRNGMDYVFTGKIYNGLADLGEYFMGKKK